MFNRKNKQSTEKATEFVSLQNDGGDEKAIAEQRIDMMHRELLLATTHPWAADERAQQTLAWSSLAYMTDRIAEVMAEQTGVKNKRGELELSPVVNEFVTTLSQHSGEVDNYAKLLMNGVADATINEETPSDLTILNHLPKMPEHRNAYRDFPPEGDRDASVGYVTPEFVGALLVAVDEIQAYAYTKATALDRSALGDIPELYTDLRAFIQGEYLDTAQTHIDYARNQLLGEVSDEALANAYEAAYHALGRSGEALAALFCPATLGPDWILER